MPLAEDGSLRFAAPPTAIQPIAVEMVFSLTATSRRDTASVMPSLATAADRANRNPVFEGKSEPSRR